MFSGIAAVWFKLPERSISPSPLSGPRRWCELPNLRDLGRWQTREQILQVIIRIDPLPPTTAQQRVDHRATISGLGMANEQPVLLSDCTGPNRILDQIIVDL